MVSDCKSANIFYFGKNFIAAGESTIGGIVEVAARPCVCQIIGSIEADGECALIKIVELIISGGLCTEKALSSRTDLVDFCGDIFTGGKLCLVFMVLKHG